MKFFDVLKSSTYDPAFYAGMSGRSLGEAARYYAALAFIIVFVYVVPLWAFLLALNPQLVDRITAVYPDSLEVTFANGELHTNQPEPLAIPNTFFDQKPANLAIFDTGNDEYSPSALTEKDTLILFKKTFAVTRNTNTSTGGDQRVYAYGTSTATSTLTKAMVTAFAEKVKPYVRPVAIVGGAFLFVLVVLFGGIGMLVLHLLYVLLPALLIFCYFKIKKQNETYHTAYVTALFASIPVSALSAIFGFVGGLPTFIYTLILLVVVGVNLSVKEQGTTDTPPVVQ